MAENVERAKTLLAKFEDILNDSNSGWCFGLKQPSAFDTHLIVFIARMMDVGREGLIPERIRQYAAKASESEEWKSVMQGRRTMPAAWFAKSG